MNPAGILSSRQQTMGSLSSSGRLPPSDFGHPLIGYSMEYMRDPLKLTQQLQRRNGNVVRTRMILECISLFGPDANQFVLQNRDQQFSNFHGWDWFIGKVFPGAIMSMDGDEHRIQRKLMSAAFKKPALIRYLNAMTQEISRELSLFPTDRVIPIYPRIKTMTLNLGASVFMGVELGTEQIELNQAFVDTVEAATALIRQPLPPFSMWRGVRGRERLVTHFKSLLPRKRQQNTPDFFSQFCHAEDDEGKRFGDQEVVDHMIFLMMAAHDTTTSSLNTLIYALGKHPEWQARLREESIALRKEHLEFDDLGKLEALEWSLKEALRLYPPLTTIPRGVAKDCEFDGYHLRQGDVINIFPLHTHHMPEIWSHPGQFDPERFSPHRAEHKAHWFGFVPFGGGHHMCLGQHFADLQVKAVMHQMLCRFRWTLPSRYQMPYQLIPIVKPRDGLPLKLTSLR